LWASGKRRESVERWAWKTENNKTRGQLRRRRRRQTRQPGVLSENRGGAENAGLLAENPAGLGVGVQVFGRSQFSLSLLLLLLLFALFILIHIAFVSMSVFWARGNLCLCVRLIFIYFLYIQRVWKQNTKLVEKMNATYLLLFTTNTNEGTKRNVQTTGPEKSNKKLRTLRKSCYLH